RRRHTRFSRDWSSDVCSSDLLSSIRDGLEHGNEERRSRGWDTLKLVGWSSQPQYDQQIRALAWAFLLESESPGSQVVNYNTRLRSEERRVGNVVCARRIAAHK